MDAGGVTVVTYANHMTAGARNYKRTLERQGYVSADTSRTGRGRYVFLGEGEKWEGFMTKIRAYHAYVSAASSEELLCVTDSFDVLACGSPEELLQKWSLVRRPILFSAEKVCLYNNCTSLNRWWGDRKRPWNQYLNSGFFMGKARDLKVALDYALNAGTEDDQIAMCKFAEDRPDMVELDTAFNIAATMTYDFFEFSCLTMSSGAPRIHYKPYNTYPVFVHIPADYADIGSRMDHYGECLLGADYEAESQIERFRILYNKSTWLNLTILAVVIFVVWWFFPKLVLGIVVLLILYLLLKPLFRRRSA